MTHAAAWNVRDLQAQLIGLVTFRGGAALYEWGP